MEHLLANGLEQLGVSTSIHSYHAVSGGEINEAYYVRTSEQEFFVKLNRQVQTNFFEFEKRGLDAIRETKTIDIPKVYGVVEDSDTNVPMLWLEWVEGQKKPDTELLLGERLAHMHNQTNSQYGLDGMGFTGRLQQDNDWSDSWLDYYRNNRLAKQLEIGKQRGVITGKREQRLLEILKNLGKWVPENPGASLLHGDLWGGNWVVGNEGTPYLIDPSLVYGDREFEIAFTRLFDGFSNQFYEAYTANHPLSAEYQDKEPIYQLYYLLVHLNIFGETYGGSVDRILDWAID